MHSIYKELDDLHQREQTEKFIQEKVDSPENVAMYLEQLNAELQQKQEQVKTYRDWFAIAENQSED